MNQRNLQDLIKEKSLVTFDNPSYDDAIIGISTDFRVVYDVELMVRHVMEKEKLDRKDAIDYITHKSISAIDKIVGNKPIVINRLEEIDNVQILEKEKENH